MGEYVESSLISGETVTYEAKHHWMIFISLYGLLTLFLAPLIAYLTDEFAVTNQRVIAKAGVISRRTIEMNLDKIESVNVKQTILGRILGYGNVTVIGTGGTSEPVTFISKPLDFRKAFQEARS